MAEVNLLRKFKLPFKSANGLNGAFSWHQRKIHNQFRIQELKGWAFFSKIAGNPKFRILFQFDAYSHAWIIAEGVEEREIEEAWNALQTRLGSEWNRSSLTKEEVEDIIYGKDKSSEFPAPDASSIKPSSLSIKRSDSRADLINPEVSASEIVVSGSGSESSSDNDLSPEVAALVEKISTIYDPAVLRQEKAKVQGKYRLLLEALINQRLLQVQFEAWEREDLQKLYEQRQTLIKSPDFMQRTFLVPFLEKILISRHKHAIRSMLDPMDVWHVRIELLKERNEWKIDQLMDTVNYHLWVVFREYLGRTTNAAWLKELKTELVKVNESLASIGGLGLETDAIRFVDERINQLEHDMPNIEEEAVPEAPQAAPPVAPPLPPPKPATPPAVRPAAPKRENPAQNANRGPSQPALNLGDLSGVKGKLRRVPPRLKSDVWITKDVASGSEMTEKITSIVRRLDDAHIDPECIAAFGPAPDLNSIEFTSALYCVVFHLASDSNDVRGYALFHVEGPKREWKVSHFRVRSSADLEPCLKELSDEIARNIQIYSNADKFYVEFDLSLAVELEKVEENLRATLQASPFSASISADKPTTTLHWNVLSHRQNMLTFDIMKRKLASVSS